ncbi:glyoxalase [Pilimelia anulata]|uniref:Glyoxalase n=1 Tax=Pilimelia anulata TaxID=53371 RepID=A0A8J3FEH0_9ACTN|nr:VOC family protein [Pilimelia anulata]GGK00386.1 glyoxalase [Pilimelia anulata]
MEQRLNFVTLAVRDVARSRAFYLDGLGWRPAFEAPGEVLFLRVAPGVVLSLWSRAGFVAELGYEPADGPAPLTLAHNVGAPAEVDAVLAAAVAAGARLISPGTARDWGGYSGYFADPDGFCWEVAHNPGPIGVEVLAESRAATRPD